MPMSQCLLMTISPASSSSSALSFGWAWSAATTALTTKGRKVSLTPSAPAPAVIRSFRRTSSVTSHCSTKVKWAAVRLESAIFSAIFLRTPRSGIRSSVPRETRGTARRSGSRPPPSWSPPPWKACRSCLVTRPPSPVPATRCRSSSSSLASARTAGVASARLPAGRTASARGAAGRAGAEAGAGPVEAWAAAAAVFAGAGAGAGAAGVEGEAGAAFAFAGGAAAESDGSSSINAEWTLATSPSFQQRRSTRPRLGDGMVTVALSVITSTSGWSSATSSPSVTNHLTISASTTPSPMSGSSSV